MFFFLRHPSSIIDLHTSVYACYTKKVSHSTGKDSKYLNENIKYRITSNDDRDKLLVIGPQRR